MKTVPVFCTAILLMFSCSDDNPTTSGVCYTNVEVGNSCMIKQGIAEDAGVIEISYEITYRQDRVYGGAGRVTNKTGRTLNNVNLRMRTSADQTWITSVYIGQSLAGGDYLSFEWSLPDTGWPLMSVVFE